MVFKVEICVFEDINMVNIYMHIESCNIDT